MHSLMRHILLAPSTLLFVIQIEWGKVRTSAKVKYAINKAMYVEKENIFYQDNKAEVLIFHVQWHVIVSDW